MRQRPRSKLGRRICRGGLPCRRFTFWGVFPALMPGMLTTTSGAANLSVAPNRTGSHRPTAESIRAGMAGAANLQARGVRSAPLTVAPAPDFGFLGRTRRNTADDVQQVNSSGAKLHAAIPAAMPGAGVVLDGTLVAGRSIPFDGSTFTITPDLGKQAGGNLFYSFGVFSLATNQTANFTGAPVKPVQDVFVRVTGGQGSTIDGTLACTYPNANFFFINPGGITFTSNASLDLQGSLALTTGDYVQFADGTRFAATSASPGATLSAAAPSAFGFVNSSPAGISVNGAILQVPDGKALLVAGGRLQLSDGILDAPGGAVGVVSTASAGTVSFDPSTLTPAAVAVAALGPVTLDGDAALATTSSVGGPISIRCSSLSLSGGATLNASTMGPGAGGAVNINASAGVTVSGSDQTGNDSVITAASSGDAGKAGSITLTAGSLQLLDGGFLDTSTAGRGTGGKIAVNISGPVLLSGADPSNSDSGIFSQSNGSGNSGSIALAANSLQVIGGAGIGSQAFDSGSAGDITVRVAGAASISGADAVNSPSGIFANSDASGKAGLVTLTAASVQVLGGAELTSTTFGSGAGGNVNVVVSGQVSLSGAASGSAPSGIFASSGTGATAPAGSISLSAGTLQVSGGAEIASETQGAGAGGNLTIAVSGTAIVSGSGPNGKPSAITADSNASGRSGNAGSVSLTAGSLQVLGGALISSQTFGSGSGGNVAVNVLGATTISGTGSSGGPSAIAANSHAGSRGGSAGSVMLTTGSLQVQGGAQVTSSTSGSGAGGNVLVDVSTGPVLLSGADSSNSDSGIYATSSGTGAGGSVNLSAASLQLLGGAQVSSQTAGQGVGGNIAVSVSGPALLAGVDASNSPSGIVASSKSNGVSGDAGSVLLSANSLQVSGGAEIGSQTAGSGSGGSVTVKVLGATVLTGTDASGSPSGVVANSNGSRGGNAGSVTLTAGSLQVSGGAQITSQTFGSGSGGSVTVNVSGPAVISGADPSNAPSAIAANSNAGMGGNAGSVTLNAASLQLLGGAQVTSQTFGSGAGGPVKVSVTGQALISGANSLQSASGILADSNAIGKGGDAGSVTVTAGSLQVLGGAQIGSATFGLGSGQDVKVSVAGQALLSDADGESNTPSGIFASSSAGGPSGDAGSVLLTAATLKVLGGAEISSQTAGSGSGGPVTVDVRRQALLSGAGPSNSPSGITTDSSAGNDGGHAGSVMLSAGSLRLRGGAEVASRTFGTGGGGDVAVSVAGRAVLTGADHSMNPSAILASSVAGSQGGDAGSVRVTAGSLLDRGLLGVEAGNAKGGDLTVRGGNITVERGQLLASSAGEGGNIRIVAGAQLLFLRSMVSAKAGGNGGAITIGSPISVLQGSIINGLSVDRPVIVTINGDLLIEDSQIMTDTPKAFPTVDLAGSLVALPTVFPGAVRGLPDVCGVKLGGDVSSFVVTGRGGVAPAPGGWGPDTWDRMMPADALEWKPGVRRAR